MAVIETDTVLTREQMRGLSVGRRVWWLRGPCGFVDLATAQLVSGKCVRYGRGLNPDYSAAAPIRIEIELSAGRYTLGAGHSPPDGIRQAWIVTPDGSAVRCE